MKTLTFICVLVVSVSVYAKTEAGFNVEGIGNKMPQRNPAATLPNMGAVMAQLSRMGKGPSKTIPRENGNFTTSNGALTKPQKKPAGPVATAGTK